MEQWDEQALREINSLDAARLAIRGALATIRDLQDQNAGLKGQSQDEAAKRKALETRLAQMDERLAEWQEQAAAWERERAQAEASRERWKAEARLEVRAEERARIETDRMATEQTLARLRTDLGAMAKASKDKEQAWAALARQLEAREVEILSLRRAKEEVIAQTRADQELIEQSRQSRDRELAASIKSRDLQIQDQERELGALRRELEDAKRGLAALARDRELAAKAKEEELVAAYALKEKDLVERYQSREGELQAKWSELETGLWQRAKEARGKLDEAVQKQFDERARQLGERSQEIETLLLRRRQELDADFERRCTEAEERYAADEKRLLKSWDDKEKRLLAKVEEELAREGGALRLQWTERFNKLEGEAAERARQDDLRHQELEADWRHKTELLLEEAARKDAERVRAQDEFIARRGAELEKQFQERAAAAAEVRRATEDESRRHEEERQNEFLARMAALEAEHEKRRGALLEEHRVAVESEKASISAQLDQARRALDEAFRAKVAELERAAASEAEKARAWKESLREEFLRKEKDLDARWSARDGELTARYETALEQQRRAFGAEAHERHTRAESLRRRESEEALRREQGLRADYEKNLVELEARRAVENARTATEHAAHVEELRRAHEDALRLGREKAFEELTRERAAAADAAARADQALQAERVAAERRAVADAARVKDLETRLAQATDDRTAMSRELAQLQKDFSDLRAGMAERDRMREVERARLNEEARVLAAAELARNLEEAERHRAVSFEDRRVEMERALASRRRALETAFSERVLALDAREQRLEEELAVKIEEYKAALSRRKNA